MAAVLAAEAAGRVVTIVRHAAEAVAPIVGIVRMAAGPVEQLAVIVLLAVEAAEPIERDSCCRRRSLWGSLRSSCGWLGIGVVERLYRTTGEQEKY